MTTTYRILEKKRLDHLGSDEVWIDRGSFDGNSPEAAIRALVASEGEGGTFAAVPARSFKPVTLTVEKVSKVKIVEGDGS